MTDITDLNVSRETKERLALYVEELCRWNPKINLVAKSTIDDLWSRHFMDSAQVLDIAPTRPQNWVDLGSGGGFPGLVVAILLAERSNDQIVTLVESDQRKCAFLRSVIRETGINARVVAKRIEDIESLGADVISARALADLPTLLKFAVHHASFGATLLFQKGKTWQEEVKAAQTKWRFKCEVVKSKTSNQSVILRVSGVGRA